MNNLGSIAQYINMIEFLVIKKYTGQVLNNYTLLMMFAFNGLFSSRLSVVYRFYTSVE